MSTRQRSSTAERTAVITGASSGIGEAVALELAKQGFNLVLASRNEAALQKVAEKCEQAGVRVLVVPTDVSSSGSMEQLAAACLQRFGKFDVWINDAGIIFYGRFLDVEPAEFRQVIETNLFGTVYGSRLALTQFKQQGRGTLINVSSGFGAVPAPYASSYVTSKFAVRGLNASLMQELYADGYRDIHVCSVLPATIDTPVYQHSGNRMGRKARAMPPVYDLDKAARRIARLVRRPRTETVIGYPIRLGTITYAHFPAAFLRLFARYVRRYNYQREATDGSPGNTFGPLADSGKSGGWKK